MRFLFMLYFSFIFRVTAIYLGYSDILSFPHRWLAILCTHLCPANKRVKFKLCLEVRQCWPGRSTQHVPAVYLVQVQVDPGQGDGGAVPIFPASIHSPCCPISTSLPCFAHLHLPLLVLTHQHQLPLAGRLLAGRGTGQQLGGLGGMPAWGGEGNGPGMLNLRCSSKDLLPQEATKLHWIQ